RQGGPACRCGAAPAVRRRPTAAPRHTPATRRSGPARARARPTGRVRLPAAVRRFAWCVGQRPPRAPGGCRGPGPRGPVVPRVAPEPVRLVLRGTVFLLLGDEGPLLIERPLRGRGGKSPPARRATGGRGPRRAGRSGRPCSCRRPPGGWSVG